MKEVYMCSPSVRNCLQCTAPPDRCTGGAHVGKKRKLAKITFDESQAIKQQHLKINLVTVDMTI